MTPWLLALPWLVLLLFVVFVARTPSELPSSGRARRPGDDGVQPFVSIVVPARNEALNIVACLRSLAALEYPSFEVIVVDDRSGDATAALARDVPLGNARRIEVVDGAALPDGWLGKPWACHQGAKLAEGELLLFTDADTTHGEHLLGRAVVGMQEEGADLLTLVGRQLMESFWERLVQPHVFLMMMLRFPDFERVARNDRWRDAIANGQYLLFTRSAYERIDGHESVQDEVVEDLALAQNVKRAGLKLRIRSAEDDLATRMYRSLSELMEGWSKNIAMGAGQSFPRWMRPVVTPIAFVGGSFLWLVPPVVVVLAAIAAAAGGGALPVGDASQGADPSVGPFAGAVIEDALVWAATACALSGILWSWFARRMGAPAWYGVIYPIGAAVALYIVARSWVRGRDVEWKGRKYRLRPVSERA